MDNTLYKQNDLFFNNNFLDSQNILSASQAIEKIENGNFNLLPLNFVVNSMNQVSTIKYPEINNNLFLVLQNNNSNFSETSPIKTFINPNNYSKKSEESYIYAINNIVESKDKYTKGHSDRVSEYSVLIGKTLNLNDKDLKLLKVGGLFHDIGKIGIPSSILKKPSKLTDREFSIIKNHPTIGAKILEFAEIFSDIIPIVKYHHEKFDGTGYPDKLKGNEIPYLARITAIADSYDAMSSKRTYRNALSKADIRNEFIKNSGSQFDKELSNIFIDILDNNYKDILKIQKKYPLQ